MNVTDLSNESGANNTADIIAYYIAGHKNKSNTTSLKTCWTDCGDFIESLEYFALELVGSFAGLAWGGYSILNYFINNLNNNMDSAEDELFRI